MVGYCVSMVRRHGTTLLTAIILSSAVVVSACGSEPEPADQAAASQVDWTTSNCTSGELTSELPAGAQTVDASVAVLPGEAPAVSVVAGSAGATTLTSTTVIPGSGDSAALGDFVTVNYCGVGLATGALFDSSWLRGSPASFPLEQGALIQGWVDGVPGMQIGEQRVLVIPGELAYGPTPPGAGIEPNETLVFLIELISIDTP